ALVTNTQVATTLQDLYRDIDGANPEGLRYAIVNMWTAARADDLLPLLRPCALNMPTDRSYIFFWLWPIDHSAPNTAWSVQGPLYLSPCAVWDDAAEDL